MTLIVGVVCKDAIVFGAESETTRGTSKYQSTKKISIVNFINGNAIVGEAGIQHLSSGVVDKFIEVASTTRIENEESIVKALEKSFREITARTIAPRLGTKTCQDFYRQEQNCFEISLGFFWDGKPSIYILNPVYGIAVKCRGRFSASGIGAELAQYLLKDSDFVKMDSRAATIEVASVVREVKTSVSGCGGTTEIVLVGNGNKPEKMSQAAIASLDEKIQFLSEKRRAERRQAIEETKQNISMEYQSLLTGSEQNSVED